MAVAYDGSIRIGTQIDQKGFVAGRKQLTSGMGSLTKSLKSFASMAAVAFGVGALISFGKASVTAASNLKSAMTGLQSIVAGTGNSFKSANAFIQDYISDGLVPATNAITAYKNLLMRGYSTDQIETVMDALKNSAAFGRQASLTMGEAVSSATEGLKNENSILVDNAGVTKNVSMMWKDYAESIGVGVQSLTKQQKIQAEVTGIMQETRFQMGDAAKLTGTYAGQIQQLSFNFNNLKIAFGNAILPIAQAALPSINAIITGLTKVANLFAQVSTTLFGQAQNQENIAMTATDATDAVTELADATTEAAKAADSAQASIDELNIVNADTNSASTASVPVTTTGTETASNELGSGLTVSDDVQKAVEKLKSLLAPLQAIDFTNLSKSLGKLKTAMKPFVKSLFEGLEWAYLNIFAPLSKFTIEEILPRFLDTLSAAAEILGKIIKEHMKFYKQFYDEFLKPISEYAGTKITKFLDKFNTKFKELSDQIQNSEAFNDLRDIFDKVYPIARDFYKALIDIAGWFIDFKMSDAFINAKYAFKDLEDAIGLVKDLINGDFTSAWDHLRDLMIDNKIDKAKEQLGLLKDKFNEVKEKLGEWATYWGEKATEAAWLVNENLIQPVVGFFKGLWDKITGIFSPAWQWFSNNVIDPIINIFMPITDKIGEIFAKLWEIVTVLFGVAADWFNEHVVTPIINFFRPIVESVAGFFREMWNKISGIFSGVGKWFGDRFTEAWTAVKTAFSSVNTFFKGVWNDIVSLFSKIGTSVGNAIGDSFKAVVNTILGFAENTFNGFIKNINGAIGMINEIPGVKISPLTPLKIPRLAAGAVIPPNREFIATLGDQRNGTNIETPESLLRQIMREELGSNGSNVESLLKQLIDAVINKDTTLQVEGRTLAQVVNKATRAMGYAIGGV